MSVWKGDELVVIRLAGRASFTGSVDFKLLINGLWEQGATRFLLDLTDCLLMDSTFLGVLAGAGLKIAGGAPVTETHGVQLLNPNQRVADSLENLGVAQFFHISACPPAEAPCYEAAGGEGGEPSREEVSRLCLEAHQLLMDISPANVPKFKDVARFLADDLAKLAARMK